MSCSDVPLFVDLDGTLLGGNSLFISLRKLSRTSPGTVLRSLLWLRHGRARFKRLVALRIVPDPAEMPFDQEVFSYLNEEKAAGREIVLATGADAGIARRIASHLGIFSAVLASDGDVSLTGKKKLAAIEAYAAGRPFDYMADDPVDLSIFREARTALLVRPRKRVLKEALATANVGRVFSPRGAPREVVYIKR